ncbi:hypothetical protein TPY_3348 [Sulfobacillus acidophilus TPY]|uniref:Uncharacterized protein n=1 Tax=Sulfobacillus acidophilus (strain ATCC 700253 / DSM 10332 / NAL) TaxID=679936 RepID=G8TY98_SULAD|nr:hypothetical protein TPY_3348 [Sulfobacillus acidophilus TPY]AEW05062.1 hypothetical protein Sulac_1565 [Sulfobacillus acidophilus DSM 10332]
MRISWNVARRPWVLGTAFLLAAGGSVLFWLSGRPSAGDGPRSLPGPGRVATVALIGADGTPLDHWTRRAGIEIFPARLPLWARKNLRRQIPAVWFRQPVFLWVPSSAVARTWRRLNVPGVQAATVAQLVPDNDLPSTMWTVLQQEVKGMRSARYRAHGAIWQAPVQATVRVSWDALLARQLTQGIPLGGAVWVEGGQGAIRAAATRPSGRQKLWQPFPADMGLVPPLLAEALTEPTLWKAPASLTQIGRRWGRSGLREAFQALHLGPGATVTGQPLPNPPLPSLSAATLAQGRALWVTVPELVSAYSPFINQGNWMPPTALRVGHLPLSNPRPAPSADFRQVLDSLPSEVVDGDTVYLWQVGPQGLVAISSGRARFIAFLAGSAAGASARLLPIIVADLSSPVP